MTGAEFDRMLEEILAEYGIGLEDLQEMKKPLPENQSGKRRCLDTAEIKKSTFSIPHRYADVNYERSAQ